MSRLIAITAAVAILCLAPKALCEEKIVAPLPKRILEAKTAAFKYNLTPQSHVDRVYRALVKWGRFRLVDESENPDLIFLLEAVESSTKQVTHGTVQPPVTEYGDYTIKAETRTAKTYTAVFSVKDRATGQILYATTDEELPRSAGRRIASMYGPVPAAPEEFVKVLRKRIEGQERQK